MGQDDGFTLIELLVAMVLSLIVLFATLKTFDLFTANQAQQTRSTDANDRARSTMDRVVDDLRGAAVIRRATATDLIYSVAQAGGTLRTERLCVAPGASTSTLHRATVTAATYTASTAVCGVADSGWTSGRVASLPPTTTTAFTYAPASPATTAEISTVGLTFNVDASVGGRTASSTLLASATLRRVAGQLPVDGADIRATCDSQGALLSLNLGAAKSITKNPDGTPGTLNVTYATTGGITLGSGTVTDTASPPVRIPPGITNLIARVTDAAGVTNTIQTTVTCT